MSDTAIRVENLSKRYRIGLEDELPDTLVGAVSQAIKRPLRNWRRLRRLTNFDEGPMTNDQDPRSSSVPGPEGHRSSDVRSDVDHDTLWALKDVSFEVQRGEVVGIIGRNGAGKSTLLKILARITHPTSGRAVINGRVGSLLEVGTGFHPELTGRENIYLNGTILGMTKAEVDRKFDEIVDFSGVEKFIDTPVKRYSSGMRVRLAFSVAAHLDPEILLVDEVLAVGDIGFQRKCLGKMEEVTESGRTVLFVSHNMAMIESLCPRTIFLKDGRKLAEGQTSRVVENYTADLCSARSISLGDRTDRKGTGEIRFMDVRVCDSHGQPVERVQSGQDCMIAMMYKATVDSVLSSVTFGISINHQGGHVFSLHTRFKDRIYDDLPSKGEVICEIPRLPLSPGKYDFNVICQVHGSVIDWIRKAGTLEVIGGDFFGTGQLPKKSHPGALVDHSWSLSSTEV
jgi:lipopolysaccharide transport system ATP-binding protein